MALQKKYVERFMRRVNRGPKDQCWEWTAARISTGYGAMGVGGRGVPIALAHRLAWEIWKGEIPAGLHVLHRCDNPPCCNPAHLFLGTPKDNLDDMRSKGRAVVLRHENAGRAILTNKQVLEIRDKYVPRVYTQQMLANEYGVARSTIKSITLNESWVGVSSL